MKRFLSWFQSTRLGKVAAGAILFTLLSFTVTQSRAQDSLTAISPPFLLDPQKAPSLLISDQGVWAVGPARFIASVEGGLGTTCWRPGGRAVAFLTLVAREDNGARTAQTQAVRGLSMNLPPERDKEAALLIYDISSARLRTIRRLPFDTTRDVVSLFWVGENHIAVRTLPISVSDAPSKNERAGYHRLYIISSKTGKITSAHDIPSGLTVNSSPVAPIVVGYFLGSEKTPGQQMWRAWRNGVESEFVLPPDRKGDRSPAYPLGWNPDGKRLYLSRNSDNTLITVSFVTKTVSAALASSDRDIFVGGDVAGDSLHTGSEYGRRTTTSEGNNRVLYIEARGGAPPAEAASNALAEANGERLPNLFARFDLALSDDDDVSLAPGAKAVLYIASGAVFVRPLPELNYYEQDQPLAHAEARFVDTLLGDIGRILSERRAKMPGTPLTRADYDAAASVIANTNENRYYLNRFVWINQKGVVGAINGERIRAVLKDDGKTLHVLFESKYIQSFIPAIPPALTGAKP